MEFHVTNTFLQVLEINLTLRSTTNAHPLTPPHSLNQLLILIGVGFMTLFFDVDNFTDRIIVTLTTLLVVATMGLSIKDVRNPFESAFIIACVLAHKILWQALPMTSYYKLIDWWLLHILVVLVLTMALHTYVAYVCCQDKGEQLTLFGKKIGG